MAGEANWCTFTALITDNAEARAAVQQSADDPQGYFDAREEDLADRGIEDVEELTGVIPVVDALERAGELAYLDWKEPADEVVGKLARLPRVAGSGVDIPVLADSDGEVEQVTAQVNELLRPSGVVVAVLDEDSDAFPLVAVAADRADQVVELGQQLGSDVRVP
ncbi:hypothetical protein B0O41_2975 [Propionibacteriaceae bacterium ES.041]|uniref:DUF6630 family protein n=1 Tax=Enemella evansiae TaxID=2016499 RepID=UPI000B96B855|nr:hypothetical protein [Enemella evansiae]OYO01100.1 hypothetical protein CGZ96_04465 [Enemella evansiae]PFG68147.1 hypothetical protein B0O41_2975 [Propionibacteriaceae bacterium ES.041]